MKLPDAVRLRHVPVGIREAVDRPGVIEEGIRIANLSPEAELIRQVVLCVAVVVDMDLITDVIVEAIEVRPARRLLERYVVGDDRDRIRLIRAHEGINIRIVGSWIAADERRLAVTRRVGRRHPKRCERQDQQKEHRFLHIFHRGPPAAPGGVESGLKGVLVCSTELEGKRIYERLRRQVCRRPEIIPVGAGTPPGGSSLTATCAGGGMSAGVWNTAVSPPA